MAAKPTRIVTVTGATGVQGGAIVRELSKHPEFSIRAVTRNPSSPSATQLATLPRVSLFRADLSQPSSLIPAFHGAEAVFGVTNYYDPAVQLDTLEECRQGIAMADIAKETGVSLFIWSTIPSAMLRSKAQFNSPRLVENKFYVSQYLKHIGVPHVDLYLGFYMDNFINFGAISRSANDGAIEVAQAVLKPDTSVGMVWTERDLGRTVAAILGRYRTNPKILEGPVYCVSRCYSMADVVNEIKKQTGGEARMVSMATSGLKDLDDMYGYYNRWGVYTEFEFPHPKAEELGIEFAGLDDWVREVVVPYCETLEGTGDGKARGF